MTENDVTLASRLTLQTAPSLTSLRRATGVCDGTHPGLSNAQMMLLATHCRWLHAPAGKVNIFQTWPAQLCSPSARGSRHASCEETMLSFTSMYSEDAEQDKVAWNTLQDEWWCL